MRFALFPFRWLDGKVQTAFDLAAFRLMEHLRCEKRILTLLVSLLAFASFVPIAVTVVMQADTFLDRAVLATFLGYGSWCLLTLHTKRGSDPERWRFYTLERIMTAVMKLMLIAGSIVWMVTGAPHAHLTTSSATSLAIASLSFLGIIYLMRTPLARPEKRLPEPAPNSDIAPAET